MQTVAIKQRFRWKCPYCGTVNICDGIPVKFTPSEAKDTGIEDYRPDDWDALPENVTCELRGEEYGVE